MKLNIRIFLMSFVLIFFISFISNSEFYKYTDKNGNIRFTDNLNDIPEKERPKSKKYHELEFQEKLKKKISEEPQHSQKELFDTYLSTLEKRNNYRRILKDEEQKLNDEFLLLIKEKKKLQKQENNKDNVKEYNSSVLELNKKIMAYDLKRQTLQKKIDEYNKVVKVAHKVEN